MNCTEFEHAVQERLDARQTGLTPALAAHRDTCAECRAFWHSQLWLVSVTESWSAEPSPAGLMESVLRELSPATRPVIAERHSVSGSRGLWSMVISVAAVVILAVSLFRPAPPVAPPVAVLPDVPDSTMVAQTLTGLWQGVSQEYADLSVKTTHVMHDLSALPSSAELMPNLPISGGSAEGESREWLRLDRPVSDRVGQAFDFLWDALPHQPTESSS